MTNKIYALFAAILISQSAIVAAQEIYWTGNGDGENWSDADNWDTLTLPASADTVIIGAPDKTPDAPITVNLDVDEVEIASLYLTGTGNRTVKLTTDADYMLSFTSKSVVELSESATTDAEIDVPLFFTDDGNIMRNESLNATLTFNRRLTSNAPGNDYINGTGLIRFNAQLADKSYNGSIKTVIFDNPSGHIFRKWNPGPGHEYTLLANNFSLQRRLSGTVDYKIALIESGDTDRTITASYHVGEGVADILTTIVDSPDGSTGRVTIRAGNTSSLALRRRTVSFHLREGDTVHIYKSGDALIGYASRPRISGAGNFWLDSSAASEHLLESAFTYSGRTMLSKGNLILSSGIDGETQFSGSLPAGTLLEIAENATFQLNGINQTLGGLTALNDTCGSVHLDEAVLTVHSLSNSAFSGEIAGAGTLVKAGPATLTLTPGYTNETDRILRLENGLLEIEGELDLTTGSLELAGGRLSATELKAAGSDWSVTVTKASFNDTPLVEIEDEADISNSELAVILTENLPYRPHDSVILLRADTIVGAVPGGALFQYTDGELIELGGKNYRLVLTEHEVILKVMPQISIFKIK